MTIHCPNPTRPYYFIELTLKLTFQIHRDFTIAEFKEIFIFMSLFSAYFRNTQFPSIITSNCVK